MNRSELIKLKKELNKEIARRKRINELLEDKNVLEYLGLVNLSSEMINVDDKWEILAGILKDFDIKETNGIYVCVGAFCTECRVCYQEYDYYEQALSMESKYAEYRKYFDIENARWIKAYSLDYAKTLYRSNVYLIPQFEKDNIVLNPYNTDKNMNGYEEVRKEFFMNAIKLGQPKSKKLLLEKYPRMYHYN